MKVRTRTRSKVKQWEYNESGDRGLTCVRCKVFKTEENYCKVKANPLGIKYQCRECSAKENAILRKTEVGVMQTLYDSQKQSCKTRKMEQPKYTKEEFFSWCTSQELFQTLYNNWVDFNYDKNMKPSVDRINNFETYSLDNIRLMTWGENCELGNKALIEGTTTFNHIGISQYDMEGNFIREFLNTREAERVLGICYQNIHHCCKGRRNHAGGFTWKYTEKGENQK